MHTPEQLLEAVLVASDVPGSRQSQGIAASSYDSLFDFVPCAAADDFAYMRSPQAEAGLTTIDDNDWQQIIVSADDVVDWYDEVIEGYDSCLEPSDGERRLGEVRSVGDASVSFVFGNSTSSPITELVTVALSGNDLSIVMYMEGSTFDDLSISLDEYAAVVAATIDRLADLPLPETPPEAEMSDQQQVADAYVAQAVQDGIDVDRRCVEDLSARLSDADAAVIRAAQTYDGAPYYLSDAGRSLYLGEMYGCWSHEAIVATMLEAFGEMPGFDMTCVRGVLDGLSSADFVAIAQAEGDPSTEVMTELYERIDSCASDRGTTTLTFVPTRDLTGEELAAASAVVRARADAVGLDDISVELVEGQLHVRTPLLDDSQVRSLAGDRVVHLRPVRECDESIVVDTTTTELLSDPTTQQLLPERDGGQCLVGPAAADGTVFESDAVVVDDNDEGWRVTVSLRDGPDGADIWQEMVRQCYGREPSCPSGRLAIELDGVILSAPSVDEPTFQGSVSISGAFSQAEASDLAAALRLGSMPFPLQLASVTNAPAPG